MAFISNKERQKKVSKLTQSYWYKKLTIAVTIILNLLLFALLVLGIFFPDILPLFEKNAEGSQVLAGWGFAVGILAIIIILFNIVSFVLVFTIKSPNKTFVDTVDVLSKPISGKKNKKGNDIKSRASL